MKEGIPSPTHKIQPYQKEALHEILTLSGALLGVALQVWSYCTDKLGPSQASLLAAALYGPDKETKLEHLARVRPELRAAQVIGWILTVVSLFLLFYFRYRRAVDKDTSELQMKSPEGLRGCAHVLYAYLKHTFNVGEDEGTVRVTVHRITTDLSSEPEIEQVIHYVGDKVPSGGGRRFPIGAGVIGLVARSGEPQIAHRTSTTDEEYRKELVNQWGYTPEAASKMQMDRKSFIGIPIKGPDDEVIGVVFADSSIENAFIAVDESIIATASGIAAYIQERFI